MIDGRIIVLNPEMEWLQTVDESHHHSGFGMSPDEDLQGLDDKRELFAPV
ncbi:MAG: hypothetical protein ACE5D7_10400 [Fidelibacterota bacterium]